MTEPRSARQHRQPTPFTEPDHRRPLHLRPHVAADLRLEPELVDHREILRDPAVGRGKEVTDHHPARPRGEHQRQRMAEVEAVVIENNVAEFVLGQAKVTDKVLPFDELMGSN